MSTISNEQAKQEFNQWLDSKKISARKRESNEGAEEIIIDAIMDGAMVINEDKTIDLKLLFPIEQGNMNVDSLSLKHRLTVGQKNQAVKGLKPDDGDGRMLAYIAALSSQPAGIIRQMESGDDYERASAIAVYFL